MRLIIRFILCLTILLPLASCGGREKPKYKIALSQPSADDWRLKMNEEVRRELIFHPEAEVEIRSANDDPQKQIADLKYFKENGYDAVIVAPIDEALLSPAVKEVHDAGIPIVVFDRSVRGDDYTAMIGVDNRAIGREAARYAYNTLGHPIKVFEIQGLYGSTPVRDRHEGFYEVAAENPGIDMVGTAFGDWNEARTRVITDSLIKSGTQFDVLYAHNDRMAMAAADMLRKAGRDDVFVVGIDGAPNIGIKAVKEGKIDATFLYPTEGYTILNTTLDILEGRPYEREHKLPPSSAVNASNADILLSLNESIKGETDKIQALKQQVDKYWSQQAAQQMVLYATVAVIILLIVVIAFIYRSFQIRRRHQHALQERNRQLEELMRQLDEATQSKLVFFTNVSHDLRTPLTLIEEPVEQLQRSPHLDAKEKTLADIAAKNVKILNRLINQILDFRKYENGKLDLNLTETSLGTLARDWAESFRALASKRDIKLSVDSDESADCTLAVDVEKMERIVFNLLSNAFKFTPDNGAIRFGYTCDDREARIIVSDNGKGMEKEELARIFERFYQVEKSSPTGSGIGLSLTKAFVELHGGRIAVESEPGKGTTFTVTIPVNHIDVKADEATFKAAAADVESELGEVEHAAPDFTDDKPLMLVVDDNADMRKMIRELMKDDYNVITARDGREGLQAAMKHTPDIVVCDVMMPVMDGMECCRRLKGEVSTSHIPVLMLTACGLDEQRAEGYESGADGYVAKPFNADLFSKRCRALIENRKRIYSGGAQGAGRKPAEGDEEKTGKKVKPALPKGDIDSEFYKKFVGILEREIANTDLSLETVAGEMGLSQSQVYRKIKALTNYSPVDVLKQIRIGKARELLVKTEMTVGEIATATGFANPTYLTRRFREAYGQSPSDFRKSFQG